MSNCRSCGANIEWVTLQSGKKHPCDPEELTLNDCEDGDKLITHLGELIVVNDGTRAKRADQIGMVSHFSTCPDADDWRKSSKGHKP